MTRTERLLHVGRLVSAQRSFLGQGIGPIARSINMSPNTWAKVENGHDGLDSTTYGRIEARLGWPAGSIQQYLDGGPAPTEMYEPEAGGTTGATLPQSQADALQREDDHGEALIEGAVRAALEWVRTHRATP
jgi:hypothetical protein